MQDKDKARTNHSFTSFRQQAAFAFLITPEVLGKLTGAGGGGGRGEREMGEKRPGDSSSLCRPASFFAERLQKETASLGRQPIRLGKKSMC